MMQTMSKTHHSNNLSYLMIKTIESPIELFELIDKRKHYIILFTIDTCHHCEQALSMLEQMSETMSDTEFYTFNVTNEPNIRQMYMLIEFPTSIFLYGSLIKKMCIGMKSIREALNS